MAPSTLGPISIIQDNPPLTNEICSIRLPIDMSLGDTTNPTTWSVTGGHGLGKPHSCIVLSVTESSADGSRFELQVLVLRSFGVGGRAKVEKFPHNHLLLPLPFAGAPPSTPVGFGAPLVSPKFEPLKETWLVARLVVIEVLSQSNLRKYVPRATFPVTEIDRIKSYIKKRLNISRNSYLMQTPPTGSSLNAASAISPGPSSASQAFPSLPHAVLAKGTTARTWSQVVGEAADKKAADKAATEKVAAETPGRSYEEEFPRYVGGPASTLPITFDDPSDYPDALVIYCPDEMAYEPWSDSEDNRSSSPPPAIPFLVEMEVEAKIAQSKEDVELWLRKI